MKIPNHFHSFAAGLLAVAMAGPGLAFAQCLNLRNGELACPPAEARCVKDRYDYWFCSATGGDARLDRYGNPACGAGACVKDSRGDLYCSIEPRGNAALDSSGNAVCSSRCVQATGSACRLLTK